MLVAVLILVVASLTVGPVTMLLLGSLSERLGEVGKFTLKKYTAVYSDPLLPRVLINTLIFTLGSALFSTVLGTFLAYLSVRTDIPLKRAFGILLLIPMMFPHVLFAAAWIILLNPTNGLLNQWLRGLLGVSRGPLNIYSLGGMIFLEGLLDLPVTFMVISPALYSFDISLEEASRVSGATNAHTLRKITLPMLRPAVLAAFMLAIIRSLAAFAVPQMVGIPGRIQVLTTYVYRVIAVGWSPDYGRAAALGVVVLVSAISLSVLYRYLTSASERFVTVTGKGFRPTIVNLGRLRYVFFGIVLTLFCVLIVIPVLTLIYMSFLPYTVMPGTRAWSLFSFANWQAVFQDRLAIRSIGNTALLAVSGATLGVLLSVFVAYVLVKVKGRGAALLDLLVFLSFSFPGLIIGVGFMWFLIRTPLYGTLGALLVGYIGTYLPYGVRPLTSAFIQVHSDLEDSSRVCGASFLGTLRRIIIPLIVPGVMSAWVLMATMFVRELSVSAVLSRPGSEVLSVQIMRYAYDGLWGKVSALGILMIGLSTSLVVLANLVRRNFQSVQ
ncbi:MAG: ABC transporter permease [Candidatus Bipolaricaulaceae bacterium]